MTYYRRKKSRDIERFKYCHRCGGANTDQIGLSDNWDQSKLCYVGWCWDCNRDYGYSTRIETVIDRKGRI